MKILHTYFNDSNLELNTDKTAFLVIAKPMHQAVKDEMRIEDD